MATLRELKKRNIDDLVITVISRDTKRNHRKLKEFSTIPGFRIIWGDMLDRELMMNAVREADIIYHFGGLVSPAADYNPKKTLHVNVASARLIAECVRMSGRNDEIYVVYIGSIAQFGDNRPPNHWGASGSPCIPAVNDPYAVSKIEAEREIVDGGVKHWVSLRQTGILCPEIINKGSDPITFHVPLKGVLEWTTAEDTGRLMSDICEHTPESGFWNRFHNIGSGESYRLTNYEFISLFMKTLNCPEPEKIFRPEWFALYNFHGQWWRDSDSLEQMFHFRGNKSVEEYFRELKAKLPWYVKLASLVPAQILRLGMKYIASKKPLGPLYWRKISDKDRIRDHFGSLGEWDSIPDWDELLPELKMNLSKIPDVSVKEIKIEELTLHDMIIKAEEYQGKCLSAYMDRGDVSSKLDWECKEGHKFSASPALVYLGGHWCPECLRINSHLTYLPSE